MGVQGVGLRVNFALGPDEIGRGGDLVAGSADGSQSTASQKIAGILSQTLGGHAHGQAALPCQSSDDEEDLFKE